MVTPANPSLERNRAKVLAKSFYRTLRSEGLNHDQIIELSAALLDLVTDEMKDTPAPPPLRVA